MFRVTAAQRQIWSSIVALTGGRSLALAIPVLTAPVLGRLYTPAEYGLLGAYMSIAVVVTTIGNWQYSLPIVFEQHETRVWALVRVCLWTSSITSALALLGIVVAEATVRRGIIADLRHWLWVLPFSAFVAGMAGCFTAVANRFSRYKTIALIQVLGVAVSASVSIALGFLGFGVDGLFIGYFASQLASFLAYLWFYLRISRSAPPTSWALSRALFGRHRDYALYTMPTSFIEQISLNAPVYALGYIGAANDIGLLARARQLLSIPFNLAGSAIGQVFQRNAAEEIAQHGNSLRLFNKTLGTILALGLLPTAILTFAAPYIFGIYLGEKWQAAGEIARVLAPMLLLQLISSPLSSIFYIRRRQRLDFILTIGSKVLILGMICIVTFIDPRPMYIIASYSIAMSLRYIAYLYCSWELSKDVPACWLKAV